MKVKKIVHWTATGLLSLMMVFSAYAYVTKPEIRAGFAHLGFPDYFRIQLAVAKLLGVVLLLTPVPGRVKEWAYAGFGINFISAFIAHVASGDPASAAMMPLVILALLIISYVTRYHRPPAAA